MRWYGRLRRSAEIAAVRRRGRRRDFAGFALYESAAAAPARFCVTVSKAVGGAVVRNLVRRRIRGALDEMTPPAGRGGRFVIVARPAAAELPYERLANDLAVAMGLPDRRA